jgi:hypothetical protein
MAATWTNPFHGVSHLIDAKNKNCWVTVSNYGTSAIVKCWFEGCGMSPIIKPFGNAVDAKKFGESWFKNSQ